MISESAQQEKQSQKESNLSLIKLEKNSIQHLHLQDTKRKNVYGTIIHSDQGFQYTSYEYKAICESNGIQISMSRKGTPIDDSPMESWHGILKNETLYNNDIKNINEYQALVEDWIEFYNTTRIKIRKKFKISP